MGHCCVDLALILNETGSPQKVYSKECCDWTLYFNKITLTAGLKRN